ncbi:hypothetical protein, partial [Acinetobacter indicus]|uniref:hypothetical protein n=1 Tax=Acinetobacter indicus TaxID=756892 RepID=UPI001C09C563
CRLVSIQFKSISSQKWLSDGRACSRMDSKCSDKDIKNERIYIHSFLLHFTKICLTDWHYPSEGFLFLSFKIPLL